MEPIDRMIDVGVKLHVRQWGGGDRSFLLIHGLSSNARTWDGVAQQLAAAGWAVTAVDQRGHGLSEKPASGYDFATVTGDLRRLIEALRLEKPVLAGQSWGGNVLLAFGARYPGIASHLIFVDGGFLELHRRGSWEQIASELRPPDLIGTPREVLRQRIAGFHPDWSTAGIEATLHNFETLPDGTVRPWLSLDRHMAILRAMYEQRPADLYPQVQEPVLICAADDGSEWAQRKWAAVETAVSAMPHARALRFAQTDHDIHVQRPLALAEAMLEFVGK
ncbi:MAG: alpha/beta hydrolase [Ardenticatenaceae bacterium]|nr:alpha/beta hydrolase [Ardenticatenaceae bacterium]